MNRIELYQKTRKTLLDAWRNGELKHGRCSACAVGNICGGDSNWGLVFRTNKNGVQEYVGLNSNEILMSTGKYYDFFRIKQDAIDLIKSTGYTVNELMKIEYAFESSLGEDYEKLSKTKKGQYIGLQAVFKVLDEIHKVELPTSEEVQRELDYIAINFGVKVVEI